MGKLVLMTTWAKAHFEIPPCQASLNRYARTKQTFPPAIKQGCRWLIDEDAEFIGIVTAAKVREDLPQDIRADIERIMYGSQTPTP